MIRTCFHMRGSACKGLYQVSLLAVEPGSSVFLVAHSLPLSPPRRERGGEAASLQGNSPPLAGGFWHSHSRTPTGAGCSTYNTRHEIPGEKSIYKEFNMDGSCVIISQ